MHKAIALNPLTYGWRIGYGIYARMFGPAMLELMKQRSQTAKLLGLRP